VRHRRYEDLSSVVPRLSALFEARSTSNPDFVFLEEQIGLAQQTREITELPLREAERIALRERQENKALLIENKRRIARGEEPLASLEDDAPDEEDESLDDATTDEEELPDVLLTEAGNVLVDALLLKQRAFAVHVENGNKNQKVK
jgi:carboxyl-terminal processing protease